jgi:subtilisin family serine protease
MRLATSVGAAAAVAPASAPFHPNRILVMLSNESHLAELQQFHTKHQRKVLRTFASEGRLHLVGLPTGEQVENALASYRASGLVRFAEPDYVVTTASTLPNDPRFQDGTQWWLNNYGQNGGLPDADLDAPEAWDVLTSASDVVVAILDTGVRYSHEDLTSNLWTNPLDQTHGFNALGGDHDPWDDNGHGTHVAGIIGAVGDNATGVAGVAWRVRIMACKFLDSAGVGFNSDAVACVEFARANGAHIINLSWGSPEFSAAVSNALWSAREDGILVVAAAGNSAGNTDLIPFYPASLDLDNLITVGASTRDDTVWSLSNYGPGSVDLFAPGAAIYSTAFGGESAYATRSGTSMAAACVAGALALLRQREPAAPCRELIARLMATVDAAPAFAGKCASGGRLNLNKALDQPFMAVTPDPTALQLRIQGVPGRRYVLDASTNLTDWTTMETNTTALDGHCIFVDAGATNLPRRFYHARPGP